MCNLFKENTEVVVLLAACLVCLAVLVLPLILEIRKDRKNKKK